jgi:plasmid stability protein
MTSITIKLDDKAMKKLRIRAKKNFMNVEEMASDIVRRSMISYKGKTDSDSGLDDSFVKLFSRKK